MFELPKIHVQYFNACFINQDSKVMHPIMKNVKPVIASRHDGELLLHGPTHRDLFDYSTVYELCLCMCTCTCAYM